MPDDRTPEEQKAYNDALERANELLKDQLETQQKLEKSVTGGTVNLNKQFLSLEQIAQKQVEIAKLAADSDEATQKRKQLQDILNDAILREYGHKESVLLSEEKLLIRENLKLEGIQKRKEAVKKSFDEEEQRLRKIRSARTELLNLQDSHARAGLKHRKDEIEAAGRASAAAEALAELEMDVATAPAAALEETERKRDEAFEHHRKLLEDIEAIQSTNDKSNKAIDARKLEVLSDLREANIDVTKVANVLNEVTAAGIDHLKKQIKPLENIDTARRITLETIETEEEAQTRVTEELDESAKKARGITDEVSNIYDGFFGTNKEAQTFVGRLIKSKKAGEGLGETLSTAANEWVEKMKDGGAHLDALVAKAQEGFIGLVSETKQMFMGYDQSLIDLRRSTGQLDTSYEDFSKRILRTASSLNEYGVMIEDVSNSYGTLINSSSAFASMTEDQQEQVAGLSATFEKLGVDSQSFSSVLDSVSKTYGGTIGQTKQLTERLTAMGRALNRNVNQVMQEFSQSLSTLSAYSLPQAQAEFEKLTIISQQTGVASQQLLSIVGKFDTFSGAADAVGELNAYLKGPYLNTLDMINATETERIGILQEAITASGQSWQSMDRYQKKAIAASLGIQDLEVASRMFSGQAQSIEEAQAAIDAETRSIESLSDRMKDNVSIQEMFSILMQEVFAEMKPEEIREFFTELVDVFRMFVSLFKGLGSKVIVFGIMAAALMPVISLATNVVAAFVGIGAAITKMKAKSKDASNSMTQDLQKSGNAAQTAKGKVRALTMGFGMVASMLAGPVGDWLTEQTGSKALGGAVKGAGTGAMMGSMLGPWGMLAGAAIGGVIGGMTADDTPQAAGGMPYTSLGPVLTDEAGVEARIKDNKMSLGPGSPTVSMFSTGERILNNKETNRILERGTNIEERVLEGGTNIVEQRVLEGGTNIEERVLEKGANIEERVLEKGANIEQRISRFAESSFRTEQKVLEKGANIEQRISRFAASSFRTEQKVLERAAITDQRTERMVERSTATEQRASRMVERFTKVNSAMINNNAQMATQQTRLIESNSQAVERISTTVQKSIEKGSNVTVNPMPTQIIINEKPIADILVKLMNEKVNPAGMGR